MQKRPWRELVQAIGLATLVLGPVSVISCSDSDVTTVVPPPPEPGTVASPSPSASPSPEVSPSPSESPSPEPSASPSPDPSPSPSVEPSPSPSASPSAEPSPSPSAEASPSPSPPVSASPSPSATPSPSQSPVAAILKPGQYGGSNIQVTAATNEVTFKYACASGKVDGPLTLTTINGTENSFDTTGTYRDEIGPVPSGGYPTYTARYQGYVTPTGSLRFTVSYTDSGGNSVEKTFDGFLDADPSFTEVCALSSPVPSVSASPSPQIQTSN